MREWSGYLQELDKKVRLGRHAEVRRDLLGLNLRQIPREYFVRFARLFYRSNLPLTSLRLIGPAIHQTKRRMDPATSEEVAEYSVGLLRIGASREAEHLLEGLAKSGLPKVHLYLAFVAITQWDYQKAAGALLQYLQHEDDPYQRLVAQTNLAAAQVFLGQFAEAGRSLSSLRKQTKREGHLLLFANALELSAQLSLANGDYERTEGFLELAEATLKKSTAIDELFVRKWKTLLQLDRSRGRSGWGQWEEIRNQAFHRRHWETIRENDFYKSVYGRDDDLFARVYFGTPFSSYREYMKEKAKRQVVLPNYYDWQLKGGASRRGRVFNVSEGQEISGPSALRAGFLEHRCLQVLASDIYRPVRLGALFGHLYPDEFFDAQSSPTRVHQVLRRLRRWLEAEGWPILIKGRGHAFALQASVPVRLRLSLSLVPATSGELQLQELARCFQREAFSSSQAAQALGVSKRQINKLLAADDHSLFEKVGSGPQTKYRSKS
ncbi:MAG: hypothetical protein H6624_04865 [Bdellovibrionaceae bacterium]|nr:hypothetical protein [Bdellovibrionales bacterium]MCB9083649.1 hypothetical protein [Pseudobdellovibrionaceae bacterium]